MENPVNASGAEHQTLMLIDGHSLAFRAYHALPATIRDPAGAPVNAIYGFLAMLFRLIETSRPDALAVAFDVGIPFRVELYDQYKAGRLELDPAVEAQVERLRRVLVALDIPQFEAAGYEADDILKTLAHQAEAAGIETLIVSGDRDLFQVVSRRTRVLYPTGRNNDPDLYDPERIEQRYGVRPDQFRDFKALVGDPSDNIPGVRGIGAKGAARLLQTYGALDVIYANLDQVAPPRVRKALVAPGAHEQAELARRLVTLVEVPGINLNLESCRIEYDRERARQALAALGFRSLQTRLP
ncbi:MAG TPA: hypothetical protein DEP84_03070 [Chloroflexi bacterium]|nr:hypothetical protein [Chloroflexota bacterium]